jgi:hypothetical protein
MTIALPTAADVRAIIETSLTDGQIEALIADAALAAEKCLLKYDEARQKAIVKWLTAHLIASTGGNGVLTSQKLGDASETYARATLGDGLKGTTYGQQALLLDTCGCLARLGRARASVEAI